MADVAPGRPAAAGAGRGPDVLAVATEVITAIRKAKSQAKVSMRAEVASVTVAGPPALLSCVAAAEWDLRAAGRAGKVEQQAASGDGLRVTVTL